MGQIANGVDTGHPGAAFKGVYIALQFGGHGLVGRIFAPAVQGAAGGVDQVVGFFQEDAGQFRVEFRQAGQCILPIAAGDFLIGVSIKRRFGLRQNVVIKVCRRFGACSAISGAVDPGLNVGEQVWCRFRWVTRCQGIDHGGQPVMAAEQQVRQ